jgi:hypothetical protein
MRPTARRCGRREGKAAKGDFRGAAEGGETRDFFFRDKEIFLSG